MQDPFRPQSNTQLIREAQIAFVVIAALLCVLVYVGFQRVTGRKIYFQQITQSAPVAQHIDGPAYLAQSIKNHQVNQSANLDLQPPRNLKSRPAMQTPALTEVQPLQADHADGPNLFETLKPKTAQSTGIATANFITPVVSAPQESARVRQQAKIDSDFPKAASMFDRLAKNENRDRNPESLNAASSLATPVVENTDFLIDRPMPEIKSNFGAGSTRELPTYQLATDRSTSKGLATPPKKKTRSINSEKTTFLPTPSKGEAMRLAKPLPVAKPKPKVLTDSHPTSETLPTAGLIAKSLPIVGSTETPKTVGRLPVSARVDTRFETAKHPATQIFNSQGELNQTPDVSPTTDLGSNDYRVLPDESLWSIAVTKYGDGRFFRALYQHNVDTISSVGSLEPGTILDLPDRSILIEKYSVLCPADQVRMANSSSSLVSTSNNERDYRQYEQEMESRYHVTQTGDTLFNVARQRLGQASRYLEIFELNRFRIPYEVDHLTPLKPGLRLLLPE